MKTHIKHLSLLPVLMGALFLMLAGPVTAQAFKTLHSFTNATDGLNPQAGLILSGNTLYGTTAANVFAISTDGTALRTSILSPPATEVARMPD